MTSVERRPGRPRSAKAEAAILDATVELLVTHGVDGLSIEAVAATAGVAKTTVYRRWPGKNELILDALTRLKGELIRPPGESVRGDLLFLLERVRHHDATTPVGRLTPKLIGAAQDHPELAREYFARLVGPRRAVFREVLERGVAEGTIRPDADLGVAAAALINPVLVSAWLSGFEPYASIGEAQLEPLVDLVLAGLAPKAAV